MRSRIGRNAQLMSGVGFPHEYQGKIAGDLPFLKVSDLQSTVHGSYAVSTAANYISRSDAARLGARVVPPGSVIFPKVGAALLKNTRRLLAAPAVMDNNLMALRPFLGDPRYWYYAMSSIDLGEISGSGPLPYVNEGQVRDVQIRVPLGEEQRRIADFLDAETAHIDETVRTRQQQLDVMDELALAKVSTVMAPNKGASIVRLGYLATVQSGVTIDGNREPGPDGVTRPYLRVANVQVGYVDLESVAEVTVPRSVAMSSTLRHGDVLMTEGGDLDKLGRGTVWKGDIPGCLHQNHVFAVRPLVTALDPDYLALLTRTVHARSYFESTGTKTTNLASTSSSKIRDFRVPLIPLKEQRSIVTELTAWFTGLDALTQRLRSQLALLAERRQALITAAVTGQFDVTTARGADLT